MMIVFILMLLHLFKHCSLNYPVIFFSTLLKGQCKCTWNYICIAIITTTATTTKWVSAFSVQFPHCSTDLFSFQIKTNEFIKYKWAMRLAWPQFIPVLLLLFKCFTTHPLHLYCSFNHNSAPAYLQSLFTGILSTIRYCITTDILMLTLYIVTLHTVWKTQQI